MRNRTEKQNRFVVDGLFCVVVMSVILSVLAWGLSAFVIANLSKFETGDWNPISLSLAMLQTFLAIVAFGGFWVLRATSRDSARDAAIDEFNKQKDRLTERTLQQVKNDTVGLVNETLKDYLHTQAGKQLIQDVIATHKMRADLGELADGKKSTFPTMDDPNNVSFDFSSRKAVFNVPKNDYEASDG